MKVFMLDGFLQAEQPLMPNCPKCGEFKEVELSNYKQDGSHFCNNCDFFFTPVNDKPAEQAKPLMPNCNLCGEVGSVEPSHYPRNGSHYCEACEACEDWFTPVNEAAKQADAVLDSLDSDTAFRAEFASRFPTLSYEFIETMSEVGNYGLEKYGDKSMAAKFKRGDFSRCSRTTRRAIAEHAANHNQEYIDGILHDKFGTRKHQLAAAAFNPMMEFQFSRLEKECTGKP